MPGSAHSGTAAYDSAKARLRRHAFALARELTLTDDERRELAMMLPSRQGDDPVSWATLEVEEFALLVQWLVGADKVLALYRLRP